MENLVSIHDGEARMSTLLIAQGFGRRHEQVVRLIRKYADTFEIISTLNTNKIHTKGTPFKEHLLTEPQCMFLSSLLVNSPKAIRFKAQIAKAFAETKNIITAVGKALEDFDFDGITDRYVYAAKDNNGNIKIGITRDPQLRLKQLNAAHATNLEFVYVKKAEGERYQDETKLHKAAAAHHIKGEWFTGAALEALPC